MNEGRTHMAGNATQAQTGKNNNKKAEQPPPGAGAGHASGDAGASPPAAGAAPPSGDAGVPPPTMTAPSAEGQALEVFDYGDDAVQGFENQDMSDRKLPIIELLQSNSPEVAESKGKLWAGLYRNTVTNETYEAVYMVPGITDHCWTEWVGRDDGGGFKGRLPKDHKIGVDAIARKDGRAVGKLTVPQPPDSKGKAQPDHELVESFEIYGILYDEKTDEVLGFAMIPFTSTKIKVYRAWNSAIGNFAPTLGGKKLAPGQVPIFAHRVKMTSVSETRGTNTFMVPVLGPAQGDDLKQSLLPKNDPRYIAAKKLHDDVLAGLAKAAYETTKQEPSADPESGVPF